jgi:type III secretory pathway component EscR
VDLTFTNVIGAASNYFPVSYQTELLNRIFSIATLVWIIFAAASLIAASILYVLTRNALQKARPYPTAFLNQN